jgi:hypothetical protein
VQKIQEVIPPEQMEEIRATWRLLRPWIHDAASDKSGSEDEEALQLAAKLDELLAPDTGSTGPAEPR